MSSSDDKNVPIGSDHQDAPEVTVIEGGRPTIRSFATTVKFRPNDLVKVISSGPGGQIYTVSQVKGGKYILCDDKGKEVMQGRGYREDELELVEDLF